MILGEIASIHIDHVNETAAQTTLNQALALAESLDRTRAIKPLSYLGLLRSLSSYRIQPMAVVARWLIRPIGPLDRQGGLHIPTPDRCLDRSQTNHPARHHRLHCPL